MAKRILDKIARIEARQLINNLNSESISKIHNFSRESIKKTFKQNVRKFANESKGTAKSFGFATAGMASIGAGVAIAESKGYLFPPPMSGMSYNETLDSIRGKQLNHIPLSTNHNERITPKSTFNILKEEVQSIFKNELNSVKDQSLTETVTSTIRESENEPISKQGAKEITKAIATWGISHTPYLEEIIQPIVATHNIISVVNPIKSSALQSITELSTHVTHSILNGGNLNMASSEPSQSKFVKDIGFAPEAPKISDAQLGIDINLDKNN